MTMWDRLNQHTYKLLYFIIYKMQRVITAPRTQPAFRGFGGKMVKSLAFRLSRPQGLILNHLDLNPVFMWKERP